MEAVKPLILQVITPECYDEFFVNFNFMHVECLKAAVSKGLGLGIIAGSLLVKVPQILKIQKAHSAEGINFIGLMMELFAISANLAYSFRNGFPFSSWGEGFFLALQTAAIGGLLLLYGSGSKAGKGKGGKGNGKEGSAIAALSFLACYAAGLATMLSPLAPLEFLWACQAAIIPLIIVSKMIQAFSNYRAGSTGQLSAITVSMLFFGAVARIFTSIQETGDSTVIATYVVSTLANGLILFQVLYYWNAGTKKPAKAHQPRSQPKDQQRNKKKKN